MKLLSRRVFLSYDYSPTDRFPIWPRRLYRTELPGTLYDWNYGRFNILAQSSGNPNAGSFTYSEYSSSNPLISGMT